MLRRVTESASPKLEKSAYMQMVKRLTSTAARFVRSRLTPTRISVAGSRLCKALKPADAYNADRIEQTFSDLTEALCETARKGDMQPFPMIEKAAAQLAKLKYHNRHSDEQIIMRCLNELSAIDREIFRLFQEGKRHQEIATQLNTDIDTVRHSLSSTYATMLIQVKLGSEESHEASAGGRAAAR